MKEEVFNLLVDDRFGLCRSTLRHKANEYATSDRLHNFKRAAAMQGVTPEQALIGMWAKHLVSVFDMAQAIGEGRIPPRSMIDEKLGDVINYALLFEALIEDRRNEDNA